MTHLLLSLPSLLSAVICASLAAVAWRRRPDPLAVPFVVLMLGVSEWALFEGLGVWVTGLEAKLLFEGLGFLGAVTLPAAWLVLTLRYAGYGGVLDRRRIWLLAVEPLVTLALVATATRHDLIWRAVDLRTVGDITVLTTVFGPWYYVNLAYTYLLVVVGMGLLTHVLFRAGTLYRRQSTALLLGAAIPLATNVAFNVLPAMAQVLTAVATVDLTTATFTATGVIFALALFHFDLLDLEPMARERALEEVDDGILVVDENGRVIDANATARCALDGTFSPGDAATDLLPYAPADAGGKVLALEVDGTRRTYILRTTRLQDFRNEPAGWLIVMRDVTEIAEREQRLTVVNRVLRHNIRNEMGLVLGHAEELGEHIPAEEANHLDALRTAAGRILDLSENARHLEETLQAREGPQVAVDAGAVVRDRVAEARRRFPAASFDVAVDEGGWALAPSDRLLGLAVEQLVENAVEHNDRPSPTVAVSVVATDDRVQIHVADDGPGIPEAERTALLSGEESPLEHGSGLGLWLVYWVVTAASGSVTFGTNEPRGSVVTLTLDAVDAPQTG